MSIIRDDLEKQNLMASWDIISKKEKKELFNWLESNADKKIIEGITTFTTFVIPAGR